MSAGMLFVSSWSTTFTRFGPGDFVKSEKSSPSETPKARADATKATPREADALIEVEDGMRAALKSVAMAYS
jgi:hypothetical protein